MAEELGATVTAVYKGASSKRAKPEAGGEPKKMDELIKKIKQFRQERDWDQYHSPKNLVMALSVEVAELVEHFQWLTQDESHSLPDDKLSQVCDEIGDILIYLANISEKLGIDPIRAAHDKMEKNQAKYPAETVKGKHIKYSEYD